MITGIINEKENIKIKQEKQYSRIELSSKTNFLK